MRLTLKFCVIIFCLELFIPSCIGIYDPPIKGKEIVIHNQTDQQILVLDSLTGEYFKLYDTALFNDRKYLWRKPNYIPEYGIYDHFVPDDEVQELRNAKKLKASFYFIAQSELGKTPRQIVEKGLYRLCEVRLDSLEEKELTHVFFNPDTVFIDHYAEH